MNSELKRQRFDNLLTNARETSASLAKKAKISPSIFYNFINGRSQTLDPATIEKIADILGVAPENFWKDRVAQQETKQPEKLTGGRLIANFQDSYEGLDDADKEMVRGALLPFLQRESKKSHAGSVSNGDTDSTQRQRHK